MQQDNFKMHSQNKTKGQCFIVSRPQYKCRMKIYDNIYKTSQLEI